MHADIAMRGILLLLLCLLWSLEDAYSTSATSIRIEWTYTSDGPWTVTTYTISYSNTNTDCFNDTANITGIAANETMYTLTDLQEGTEYFITLTALMSDGETVEDNITLATVEAG